MAGQNLFRAFTEEDAIDGGSGLNSFYFLLLINVEEKENASGPAAAGSNDARVPWVPG